MGQFFTNIREIIDDLKRGWYFRVWCFLWLICGIVAFVGLIEIGRRASEAGNERDWSIWMENATQITFPRLRFHFDRETSPNEIFSGVSCSHIGSPIQTAPCPGHPDGTRCFIVMADTVTIDNNVHSPRGDDRIECEFKTNSHPNDTSQLVGWSIESPTLHTGHADFDRILWLSPHARPGVWVLIKKKLYFSIIQ